MTHDHEDPQFDRWLQHQAKSYHTPPATPRDAMWERIEHARRHKRVIELRPWARWALAAAAVLLLGIGIGRWTANDTTTSPQGPPVAAAPETDSAESNLIYQMAATQYFSRAEAFLTGYRSEHSVAQNGRFASQARDLLSTTQLMLDSPAANDPRLRSLLEDLELVLVQISQLDRNGGGHSAREKDYITQSMNQSNVLPKLRSAIPAGPVPVRTEGAL